MKVLYPRFEKGNFGDDLNAWLWERLLPGVFDEDERVLVLGIGSGLAPRLWRRRPPRRIAVLGAGAGYAGFRFTLGRDFPLRAVPLGAELALAPPLDPGWVPGDSRIYWVRGPLTARLLNLDPGLAAGDPVTLISDQVKPRGPPRYSVGYMPHFRTAELTEIQALCRRVGYHYIDPTQGVEGVIEDLSGCERVLTEALHGAIAADALRVPWTPVVSSAIILPFKWADYCAQTGSEYRPVDIQPPWRVEAILSARKYPVPRGQRLWARCRAAAANRRRRERALNDLVMAAAQTPCLSPENRLEQCRERMKAALGRFAADIRSGVWASPPSGCAGIDPLSVKGSSHA